LVKTIKKHSTKKSRKFFKKQKRQKKGRKNFKKQKFSAKSRRGGSPDTSSLKKIQLIAQ
jgi:hypothetical protein